jgi:ABC-type Fe3+/spermidine/putrescine transport system ATPase subunit
VSGEPVLTARGLRVVRGAPGMGFTLAVDALDLHAGEVLAVIGENGAGKTTLLRALAGLEPGCGGVVQRATERPVALVFQRPVMLAGSVAFNVRAPLWGAGVPRAEAARRAAAALARFRLEAFAGREASTLSGGEMRRVALAQGFVREPGVLLLDEPFDDLDVATREALTLDLRSALRETGAALGLVSHDLGQALGLAERIAVLAAGRLVQIGPREHVMRRPATPEAARLVGMGNLLPGRVQERGDEGHAVVEIAPGIRLRSVSDLPVGARVVAGIRPEDVKIDVGRGHTPIVGKGRVLHTLSDGALVTLQIDWGGVVLRTFLIAGRGLGHALRPGDPVSLAIRAEDVHLMQGA